MLKPREFSVINRLHDYYQKYLGYKDQSQNSCCSKQGTEREQCSIEIQKPLKQIKGDKIYSHYRIGDIDCHCNIFGIIQSLQLHLLDGECQGKRNNLQDCLVPQKNSFSYIKIHGVTSVEFNQVGYASSLQSSIL